MIKGDNMKIYVDADASPVVRLIEDVAEDFNVSCILVSDHNHVLHSDYSEIITVGSGFDAADLKIINMIEKGDVLVTQDYGLASLALAKDVSIMNHFGSMYTIYNIDTLLAQRHLNQKIRNSNGRHKGPKKRMKEDDEEFYRNFRALIKSML